MFPRYYFMCSPLTKKWTTLSHMNEFGIQWTQYTVMRDIPATANNRPNLIISHSYFSYARRKRHTTVQFQPPLCLWVWRTFLTLIFFLPDATYWALPNPGAPIWVPAQLQYIFISSEESIKIIYYVETLANG